MSLECAAQADEIERLRQQVRIAYEANQKLTAQARELAQLLDDGRQQRHHEVLCLVLRALYGTPGELDRTPEWPMPNDATIAAFDRVAKAAADLAYPPPSAANEALKIAQDKAPPWPSMEDVK